MTTIDHLNPPTGQMADNVVGFARALRAAGIPVGPAGVIDALNALQVIEIGNRADVYATLEAIFVKRHEHMLIFAQAFDLFFRAAEDWKHMLDSVPLPDHAKKKPPPASRRVQEALAQPSTRDEVPQVQEQEVRLSVSDKEILQKKDFAQMSAAEIAEVTRAIANMKLPQAELRTRRDAGGGFFLAWSGSGTESSMCFQSSAARKNRSKACAKISICSWRLTKIASSVA